MVTFLFKEELSVTESLCLAEGFQMQGCLKGFFPDCCVCKDLPSAFEVLIKVTRNSALTACLHLVHGKGYNPVAGENSSFLGQGQVSLEESLVFWMSVIPLPHSSPTHGVFPDYLSWSILGSCHCGIEVPLV